MKRAFPQKVKPVSCHPSASASDAEAGQSRQTPPGGNRRARTSAAMIGLALSMGASSLLIPRQNDGAAAAESISTESAVEVVPLANQVTALSAQAGVEVPAVSDISATSTVEHVVRPGETLWQIARLYRVNVRAIAAENGFTVDSVIRVGQTLKIPASGTIASEDVQLAERAPSAVETQLNSLNESNIDSGASVKVERDNALQRLRQERDKLKHSLTGLRADSSPYSTATPPKDRAIVPEQQASRPSVNSPVSSQSSESVATSAPVDSSHVLAHQVKPGETLGAIASNYRVSQRDLAAVNHLANPDWLRVNQTILVPQSPSAQSVEPSVEVASLSAVEASVAANSQPTVAQPETASVSDSVVYRVNPGDTLGEIAQTYNIPETSLASANQLGNPNLIRAGQVLQIPANGLSSSATSAPTVAATLPNSSVTEQFSPEAVPPAEKAQTAIEIPVIPAVDANQPASESAQPAVQVASTATESAEAASSASVEPSQQVATASLGDPSTSDAIRSSQEATSTAPNPYVSQLMAEILEMRDRYRATGTTARVQPSQPAVVAAAPDALATPLGDSAVNPEFSPARYEAAANAQSPGLQARTENRQAASRNASQDAPSPTRPQIVATAPLGSENYEPLLQPVAGQLVSPDLPPLPGAEAFLPNTSPSFNGFIWPARGVLSSGYGWRWGRMHRGIDIAAPIGTPVHAAAAGVVEFSAWNSGGYGNMIDIRHPDGTVTRYAHLSRSLVRAGQQVEQGDQIALVGSTGYSTGPHLHFEVHLPNQGTVNPIAYLPGR